MQLHPHELGGGRERWRERAARGRRSEGGRDMARFVTYSMDSYCVLVPPRRSSFPEGSETCIRQGNGRHSSHRAPLPSFRQWQPRSRRRRTQEERGSSTFEAVQVEQGWGLVPAPRPAQTRCLLPSKPWGCSSGSRVLRQYNTLTLSGAPQPAFGVEARFESVLTALISSTPRDWVFDDHSTRARAPIFLVWFARF